MSNTKNESVRVYRPLRVPAADLAKQDAAAKKAKLSWNEWVLRKLQSFFIALALVLVGCGSKSGVETLAPCVPQAGEAGQGGDNGQVDSGTGGEAGTPQEPAVDVCDAAVCDAELCTMNCLLSSTSAAELCNAPGRGWGFYTITFRLDTTAVLSCEVKP